MKKMFFLQRKNQRTFVDRFRGFFQRDDMPQMRREKSFLFLFFKKEILLSSFFLTANLAAHAATVQVTVKGVRNARGHVRVALCARADFLHPHCPWKASVPAQAGNVVVLLNDVPPGIYAAQSFHDENDNQRMDRTLLGLPREGMGFSNNAPMHFGPPGFDAASFKLKDQNVQIVFSLKYF